jgi:hypothetical protein
VCLAAYCWLLLLPLAAVTAAMSVAAAATPAVNAAALALSRRLLLPHLSTASVGESLLPGAALLPPALPATAAALLLSSC